MFEFSPPGWIIVGIVGWFVASFCFGAALARWFRYLSDQGSAED